MKTIETQKIAGIEACYWRAFFEIFRDRKEPAVVKMELQKLEKNIDERIEKQEESFLARRIIQAISEEYGFGQS